jgi:hypothetical protein
MVNEFCDLCFQLWKSSHCGGREVLPVVKTFASHGNDECVRPDGVEAVTQGQDFAGRKVVRRVQRCWLGQHVFAGYSTGLTSLCCIQENHEIGTASVLCQFGRELMDTEDLD